MSDADTPALEVRVRLADARALDYCARGCRAWCARHDLDWGQFRGAGLPVAVVEATGDAMARRVAARVRARHAESAVVSEAGIKPESDGGVSDGR